MQPSSTYRQDTLIEAPVTLPRFWRTTFADLVNQWGEEGARRMLRAMEQAFDQQIPAPEACRPGPYGKSI
jgi:hypothetical protein